MGKKKGAEKEKIEKYENILAKWKADLPQMIKDEESEIAAGAADSIQTDESWEEIFVKYLSTDYHEVTEETKEKAGQIDIQLVPARKQPMVEAMEKAGLTLPVKESLNLSLKTNSQDNCIIFISSTHM